MSIDTGAQYQTNVFINCPFDSKYKPIFDAIVFAVIDCGYTVSCALQEEDAGPTRIDKIYRLIAECRFGIHDISRIEQDRTQPLPRFNMPFELGLFLGARHFGVRNQKTKSCLVLDTEQYRYQAFLSDISGQDIRAHGNEPKVAVAAIRDWLSASRSRSAQPLPGGAAIMSHFRDFQKALPAILSSVPIKKSELSFIDLARFMGEFVQRQAAQTRPTP
jgi:hypothetical protein